MFSIYLLLFWIPAIASGVMMLLAWANGILRRPWLTATVFAIALFLQVAGQTFSPAWTVGLVGQAILGVSLAIRLKLDS